MYVHTCTRQLHIYQCTVYHSMHLYTFEICLPKLENFQGSPSFLFSSGKAQQRQLLLRKPTRTTRAQAIENALTQLRYYVINAYVYQK